MKLMITLAVAAAAILPAQPASAAVTFFSVGAVGPAGQDPGVQPYETLRTDFDTLAIGSYAGPYDLYQGTSSVAAAPAGDLTRYLALGTGGSAAFSMNDLGGGAIRSISVYLGSIDDYNYIDIFSGANLLRTIGGANLPASNGDQGAAITNRRVYINFAASDNVTGITFRSNGIAFEFDDLASSTAAFNVPDGASLNAMPSAVPEPATWAMMLLGFGLVGYGLRQRRTVTTRLVLA